MPLLDDHQRRRFADEGWTVVRDLLGPDEIRTYADELSRLCAECDQAGRHPHPQVAITYEPGFDPRGKDAAARELGVRKFQGHVLADRWFWGTARHARIVAAVADLIGPAPRLLQATALVKPAGIGTPKDWHQDVPYFPIEPKDACVGVWIAIDPATTENGCMQVITGSHRGGEAPHVAGPTGWRLADETVRARQDAAMSVPLEPGSALLFSGALWHFTGPNRSTRRRRAFQHHYVSAATRSTDPRVVLHELVGEDPPAARALAAGARRTAAELGLGPA